MAFNVFVSYSSQDIGTVRALKRALSSTGAGVFVAEHAVAPGEALPSAILAGIKNCNLFILLWSGSAHDSEWVRAEIGAARGQAKPVLPLMLEANLNLPPFLEDLKYLRVYGQEDRALAWVRDYVSRRVKDKNHQEAFTAAAVLVGLLALSK